MKEKKKVEVATLGFEPVPQHPPAIIVLPLTTRPCDHYTNQLFI